ncbi:hypothetical protein GCM10010215_66450 [Streptomyces virginiae]|uniref:Uncharacterized protein n=1 Tax=Streptomyces virginiae TaxID=1961 RepID=A0ABQ3NNI5_STRVG|nr:hypothetical protein GCM10010215_66450 [Streptomyces virginiae]GHI14349.1 hypothetical protein Scinn_38120 [Streptomyces virginiae]GLV95957.1 hypothetical protein Slala04_74100 [Streptomyces lavendulae subsp. lavendulae]
MGAPGALRLLVRGQAAVHAHSTGKVRSEVNVAETVARALSVTTVVRVDAADVFRARMRLPGRGAGRGAGGPSPDRLPAVPGARRGRVPATRTGGREQLWGSV